MEYMKSLGSSVVEIIKAKNKHEMLEQNMDDLLSHQRQFVENNCRSLEQKIKEKEKEVFHQLHDLLRGDLLRDQINQDLQQANDALRAELDKAIAVKHRLENNSSELNTEAVQSRTGFTSKPVKGTGIINNLNWKSEMEEKNLLRCQSDQNLKKSKTAKQFLKETQNYAEEIKNKSLSQQMVLEKKQDEIQDLEGKNQDLIQQLKKMQSDLQLKQAENTHLPNQQLSKLDSLKALDQLKKQNGFAHSKLKTWMQSCR
ncbi:centromere protein F-like isoform X2 [Mauremys reevesii]|uniref:centromere protein F-like isoform X2 n=1 Tax=Mauremys reevesii TaxID=260615 RepID=UPI00193F18A9|nr:centromere protein F-like isoform X2 [Mauremys reevesii]